MTEYDLAGNPLPDRESTEDAEPSINLDLSGNPIPPEISQPPSRPISRTASYSLEHEDPGPAMITDLAGNVIESPIISPGMPGSPTPPSADYSSFAPTVPQDISSHATVQPSAQPTPPTYVPKAARPADYSVPSATSYTPAPLKTPEFAANTSGGEGVMPLEVQNLKWNWGAFYFPMFWSFSHNLSQFAFGLLGVAVAEGAIVYFLRFSALSWALLCVLNLAVLGVQIYLGTAGNQLAWEYRRFQLGLDQFFDVQTIWKNWAIGMLALSLCLTIGGAFVLHALHIAQIHRTSPSHRDVSHQKIFQLLFNSAIKFDSFKTNMLY
jgi:hypothetical protein